MDEENLIKIDLEKEFENFCKLWKSIEERGHYLLSENPRYNWISNMIRKACKNKEIVLFLEDINLVFSEEDKNALNEFFSGAIDDIKAAENLYENKIYSLSIYHIQQGIEKLSKYWLMNMLHFNYSYVKNIGHRSPMAYTLAIEKYMLSYLDNLQRVYNEAPKDLKEEPEKALKSIRKTKEIINKKSTKEELAKLNGEKINIFLNIIKNNRETFTKGKERLYKNRENLEELITSIIGDVLDENDLLEIWDIISDLYAMIFATVNLYVLASITYVHEAPTRYIDRQTSLKPSDYKPGLGIVDRLPQIIKETRWILSQFEQFEESAEKVRRLIIKYREANP